MKRRQLLRTAAAASVLGFAGCVSGDSGAPGGETTTDDAGTTPVSATDTGGGTPTGTGTPTPSDRATEPLTETPTPSGTGTPTSGGTDTPTETPVSTDTSTPTGTATDTPTPTASPTPTTSPTTPEPTATPVVDDRVQDTAFEITDATGGGQVDEASVSFDGEGNEVSITGTIWGSDGCQSARLERVELADGTLTVRVLEFLPPENEDQMCTQAIVEIDYETTVVLSDGLPDRVKVVHVHGEETTTAASVER